MMLEKIKCIVQFRKGSIYFCAVLLLLNAMFYFIGIRHQKKNIYLLQQVYSEIRQKQHDIPKHETSDWRDIRKSVNLFYEKLVPVSEVVNIVSELKGIIHQPGVVVSKMTFKPEKLSDHQLWKYTTSFTLNGTYGTLKQVIVDIQNAEHLYCIDRIGLYSDSGKDEKIELSLSITTYYQGKS